MSVTIDLPQESILKITADDVSNGTLVRLAVRPGELRGTNRLFNNVAINNGTVTEVGPFPETRRYKLITNTGTLSREIIQKRLNYNNNGTGIYEGGIVSINGSDTTKIDIATGTGVVVDNYTNPGTPNVIRVTWPDFTAVTVDNLLTAFTSYIAIDAGGNIIQFAGSITATDRRNFIVLAILAHTNQVVVETVANFPPPGYDIPHVLIDMADSVGIINRSGNSFGPGTNLLEVLKSAGESFEIGGNWQNSSIVPNITVDASTDGQIMFFSYRDGSGGWVPPPFDTEVDPGFYDDGSGTLAAVPGGSWTIQRLFYEPIGGDIIIAYGQNLYNSRAAAEASIFGEIFIKNPALNDTSFRSYLLVKGNATDLSDSLQAKFIDVDKFGSGPSGGSNTATTDLQGAYENSTEPEIVTNSTQEGICIKEGQNDDTKLLICGLDFSDNVNFELDGGGRIKGRFVPDTTANRPSSPATGQFFFDTTLGIPIWYDGTNWVDSAGTTV